MLRNYERENQKTRSEIEELFFKPIILSIDDRDKFEEREMMIDAYIPDPNKLNTCLKDCS